jgi:hypothetical protein
MLTSRDMRRKVGWFQRIFNQLDNEVEIEDEVIKEALEEYRRE